MLAYGRARLSKCLTRLARQAHSVRTPKEDLRWPGWELVIGIEVHAQIKSRRKLFSESHSSDLTTPPNTHVVPFDAAFPGTLPRLNPRCVELGVRTAIALNAEVQNRSAFDRKHYFYADLPSGYQITQQYAKPLQAWYHVFRRCQLVSPFHAELRAPLVYTAEALPSSACTTGIYYIGIDEGFVMYERRDRGYTEAACLAVAPIARNGRLQLDKDDIVVRVKQLQLEQDTGKSTSYPRTRTTAIDLNRAGMGLMEIVSEPDMRSPEEAGDYVRTLQALLRSVGSSDGNMEQGSFRCDVNVSVNRVGDPPGTRCEIKNLNSVKFMMVAITCEAFRQIALLERGVPVAQETRGFNEEKAETYSLRSKEDAPDYRYMPDPNIPPLLIGSAYVNAIRERMPELPDATRERLLAQGLSQRDVEVLMDVDSGREVGLDGELGRGAVAYFDEVSRGRDPKAVVNWITHELLGQLAFRNETFRENPISVEQMGELVDLVQGGKVTGTSGKTILRHILSTRSSDLPSKIAEDFKLIASDDDGASLEKWCREAIAALPQQAEAVRQGNPNVVNKIMGHVMKASRGTAKAQDVRAMLLKLLQQ